MRFGGCWSTRASTVRDGRLGIVQQVVEPEALAPTAHTLARRFTHAAPEDLECHAQAVCMDSDYYRDAVRRTLDKQPLAFDWERLVRKDTPS